MSWHYLPVWIEYHRPGAEPERSYSICEVYVDVEGRLENWTVSPEMRPGGTSLDELRGDLNMMLSDASRWKSVAFSALKTGMVFERVDER
jgi:hypothetical protein